MVSNEAQIISVLQRVLNGDGKILTNRVPNIKDSLACKLILRKNKKGQDKLTFTTGTIDWMRNLQTNKDWERDLETLLTLSASQTD